MVYSSDDNTGESTSQDTERVIPMELSVEKAPSLIPGFRFSLTDNQLIKYLRKKIQGCDREGLQVIAEVDVCRHEPWDLPAQAAIPSNSEWFFFCPRGRKYSTELGHWKETGREFTVKVGRKVIGKRRTLVFHIGRAPNTEKTEWFLYQYCSIDSPRDGLLVCRLINKSKHLDERRYPPRARRVSKRRRVSQNKRENNNNNNNNSTTLLSGGEHGKRSGMLAAVNEVQNICSNQKMLSSELDHPESSRSKKSYFEEEEEEEGDWYPDLLRDDDNKNNNTKTTLLCGGEGEGEQSGPLEDWKEVEVICLNKDYHSLEQPEDAVSDLSELKQPESSSSSKRSYTEEKEDSCYADIMKNDDERDSNTTTLLSGGEEQLGTLEGGKEVENICSNKDDTVSDLSDKTMGSELKQPKRSKKSNIEKEDDCFADILKDDIIKLDDDEDCRTVIKLKSRVKNTTRSTQPDKPAFQGTTPRRIKVQRYKLLQGPSDLPIHDDLHSHDQQRSNVANLKYPSIFVLVLLLVLVLVLRDVPAN